jgi:hypothetical protein
MGIPTYTEGYPPDGSSLGTTKAVIRDNLDGTFLTLGVDHVNNNGIPGSNPAGYHTIIHEVTQTSTPMKISGVNQIFSGNPAVLVNPQTSKPNGSPSGDTQLFTLTGGGGFSQLTGGSAATNGYQWIGGVLIQWGVITGISTPSNSNASGSVTFTSTAPAGVAFPNNCFGVQLTSFLSSAPGGAWSSGISAYNATGFSWYTRGSSALTQLNWFAIGN